MVTNDHACGVWTSRVPQGGKVVSKRAEEVPTVDETRCRCRGRRGRRSARGTADGSRIKVGTASRGQEVGRSREGLVEGVKVESVTRDTGCNAQEVRRRIGRGVRTRNDGRGGRWDQQGRVVQVEGLRARSHDGEGRRVAKMGREDAEVRREGVSYLPRKWSQASLDRPCRELPSHEATRQTPGRAISRRGIRDGLGRDNFVFCEGREVGGCGRYRAGGAVGGESKRGRATGKQFHRA